MNGFTFFQNYFDAISDEENGLSEEEQGRLYNAIFAYMFRNEEPNLKGACKMAFNLIKPSLDRSKQNGNNGGKGEKKGKSQSNEIETKSKSNQNEIEMQSNEIENENPPFFENKEREEEKEDISVGHNTCAYACGEGEQDETVTGYLGFLRSHPGVSVDITNPSFISSVDYDLLSVKISESKYLQSRRSLNWLIKNYRKIVLDSYKDYSPPVSPAEESGEKGDLQLWSELVSARNRAKEERVYDSGGASAPLFRMINGQSKDEMGAIYKGLSPEIRAYFDPNSFLELCEMEDAELKYERARFLKALGGIRLKLTKEAV